MTADRSSQRSDPSHDLPTKTTELATIHDARRELPPVLSSRATYAARFTVATIRRPLTFSPLSRR